MTFGVGDLITIVCRDGASFTGECQFVHEEYIILDGRGYPLEDVKDWAHA